MTTAPTLEVIAPVDTPTIITKRWVKAPPELVFQMYTVPEHMKNWLGPKDHTMTVCDVDLRVGGAYRWLFTTSDGTEHGFRGEFREVAPPHRLVSTFIYDPWPDAVSVDELDLTAVDGGCLITTLSTHVSIEARDAMVESGMEYGMEEGYQKLDAYVERVQA